MGAKCSRTDFEWTCTEEPHASRRAEILKKYPEIKKLFGCDPKFKYIVLSMVLIQFVTMYFLRNVSWPVLLIAAYCFGGVINHSLMLSIHEMAHNLAFGHSRPTANRILSLIANLPIGIPFAITFKYYHLEHHRYQGDEKLDTDIPTYVEAKLFCTTFGKFIWVCLQPFFYAFRPIFTYPKSPTVLELFNSFLQISFDVFIYYFLGGRMVSYMLLGSLMAMGLHPVAGHFVSEHYMFRKGFETYSYYGPLNWITFNVGYHNEHHDFPAVPGSRLPLVKKIASEYYDNLPQHHSWSAVLYDFVTDPEVGPYARIRRKHKGFE